MLVDAETAGSDADSEEEVLPDWGHEKTEKPPLKLGKVSITDWFADVWHAVYGT